MAKGDWTGFFKRRGLRRGGDGADFADYGTAFGLDLSLAPPLPEDDVPPPAPVRRAPVWVQRLTGRAKLGA